MTNPLDPAVEALLVKHFTFKKIGKDLKPEGAYLTKTPFVTQKQIDDAKTDITRLLLRKRVAELEYWFGEYMEDRRRDGNGGRPIWLNTKPISIKSIESRIATLEALIKELDEQ